MVKAHLLAIALVAILAAPGSGDARAASFTNPIVEARPGAGSADPSVVFYRGFYYYCRSVDDEMIAVARTRRLQDIGAAPMVTVYRPPPATPYSHQIWAPELQRVRGRWYIYFAASDGDNAKHRMYALQATTDDPQGRYAFKGRVTDRLDRWAIDGVSLEWAGKLYFVWSGWPDAKGDFPQLLYIAAMRNPWTIAGPRRVLARPVHSWERAVAPLLEAPEPIRHRGKLHLVYSAGASWSDDYALGLLSLVGADPLEATSWVKTPFPLFTKNTAHRAFGVGHASFVRSPDGRQDWIVYHATDQAGAGWQKRSVRAQPFGWAASGVPMLGIPVPLGCRLDEPSGTPRAPVERVEDASARPRCPRRNLRQARARDDHSSDQLRSACVIPRRKDSPNSFESVEWRSHCWTPLLERACRSPSMIRTVHSPATSWLRGSAFDRYPCWPRLSF